MQALGNYNGGKMLFLELEPVRAALIVDSVVVPMELGHLCGERTEYEYLGDHGRKRLGGRVARQGASGRERFRKAMQPDEIVCSGNARQLETPPDTRLRTTSRHFTAVCVLGRPVAQEIRAVDGCDPQQSPPQDAARAPRADCRAASMELSTESLDQQCINTLRFLSVDMVQKANSGTRACR